MVGQPLGVDPASIDGAFVAARRPGVHLVPIPGATALLDRVDSMFLVLNPTGVLVWQCLDGRSPLGDVCRDLAEVVDAPYDVVLTDTIAVVRRMVERGLVVDDASRTASSIDVTTAAPSRGAEVGFTGAAGETICVQVGEVTVGIRCNDLALLELLAGAIEPGALTESACDPTISVKFGQQRGSIPGMHALYVRGVCVLRAIGEGRMLRAALHHLDAFIEGPEPLIRLPARVLISRRGATLVGGGRLDPLDHASPRLGRLGWRVLDVPGPLVDTETLDVVVREPAVARRKAGVTAIDRRFPRARSERAVAPARYPVRALVVVGTLPGDEPPADDASRLEALLPLTMWPWDDAVSQPALETVVRLAQRTPPVWLAGFDDRELIQRVDALAPEVT